LVKSNRISRDAIGILTLGARRVRPESVWVRNIEFVWPNIAVLGRSSMLFDHEWGSEETEIHSLPHLAWAVPIDDTNHVMLDMVHMPIDGTYPASSRGGAIYPSSRRPKSYDDMQRMPGNYEAQVSQRPIPVHALEHLGTTIEATGLVSSIGLRNHGCSVAAQREAEGHQPYGPGGDRVACCR
jgi:hypothetical protein